MTSDFITPSSSLATGADFYALFNDCHTSVDNHNTSSTAPPPCSTMMIERTWQLSMLSLLTHTLLLLTSNSQSINGSDLSVLLSFKSHITNDPRQALSSWNAVSNGTNTPAPDFCRWTGVACSDRRHPGHVTAIRLRGFGLVGSISPQLGNLTRLRVLDLSVNNLAGAIPFYLGGCAKLRAMNLSVNYLSGTIPAPLGQLSKLTRFSIRHNHISGDIPMSLSNLTALTVLSIENNYFHGQIPSWLGNLTSLTTYYIFQKMASMAISPQLWVK